MKKFLLGIFVFVVLSLMSLPLLAQELELELNQGELARIIYEELGFEYAPQNPDAVVTRADAVIGIMRALNMSSLAEQIAEFEASPFIDINDNIGYFIMAHHFGAINGVGGGRFAPADPASAQQVLSIIERLQARLSSNLHMHAFYAFGAFGQRHFIENLDTVSLGWSILEYTEGQVRLNTGSAGGNQWRIPDGYELIADYPKKHGVATHLSVFMEVPELYHFLANNSAVEQAVQDIFAEATREFSAIGRRLYDGVTINFEGLRGDESAERFTAFLNRLSAVLATENLSLYVTVHPTTIDGIYFDGYDFRAIGEIADRVILMAHDYHPRSLEGLVGTSWQRNAALTPIGQIYRALSAITHPETGVADAHRVSIAFSFVNVGWFIDENGNAVSDAPVVVSNDTAYARMNQPDTIFGWSETFRNPYIIYTTENDERVFLWFQNEQSIAEKLRLARLFGIEGASFWRLGIIPEFDGWSILPYDFDH